MSVQTLLFAAVHLRLINAIQGGREQCAYNWTRILCHMAECDSCGGRVMPKNPHPGGYAGARERKAEESAFITVRRSELLGLQAELSRLAIKAEADALGSPNEAQDTFMDLYRRVTKITLREQPMPTGDMLHAVRMLLRNSWRDIHFNYDGLTEREKAAVSRPVFQKLVRYIGVVSR